MKVQKGSEITVKNIVMTIYGQPDTGKTTLGLSAKNPLLLDFDGLVYKAKNNSDKDIVSVQTWSEVANANENDFKGYDTIVLDTCGKALDFLTTEIIKDNSKLSQRSGALTLAGYGVLKSSFTQWLKRLLTMGKDVVLLCHVKEKDENETRVFRPAVVGGSLDEIMTVSTFVGFLHFINKDRHLDFSPCENWYGKNAAEFESLKVSHYAENNHYLADVIQKSKDALMIKEQKQDETVTELKEFFNVVSMLDDVDMLNNFIPELSKMKKIIAKQVWSKMLDKAESIGIVYNKEKKLFEIGA